ncbi:ATP-dependent Clp protease proteolytic subunit 3, chloroplastic [Vitis vinifera]|uniref:Endopeptidase Clp n=1 Tax=Vitis vinifera TaxID=29760 RepID=A0A438JF04_VITVI|nr:ATP-dependent Clp protease proteolytic subunit 3, chloroplastic [Vitis vinifera]
MTFNVGKGTRIRCWTDPWCGDVELSLRFPQLFAVAAQRNAIVGDMWDQNSGQGGWNLRFIRDFNDWELDVVGELLQVLRSQRITLEEDSVSWKGGKNGKFGVKKAYSLLISPSVSMFLKNGIWVENVPTKLAFFVWEAAWGKVLTLDRLQKRGVLWEIVLGLFGAQWVFPEIVKEVVLSWKGSFVGLGIYDAMKLCKADVSTVCLGLAASMGAFLLASGSKGKSYMEMTMEDKDDFGCLELIHESLKEMEALQLEMVLAEPECFLSFLSAFNGDSTKSTYSLICFLSKSANVILGVDNPCLCGIKKFFGNAAVQKELALKQVGFRDSKEMDSPLLMEEEAARRAAKEEYCKWALIEEIS